MFKTKIALDEAKIAQNSDYTVEQCKKKVLVEGFLINREVLRDFL